MIKKKSHVDPRCLAYKIYMTQSMKCIWFDYYRIREHCLWGGIKRQEVQSYNEWRYKSNWKKLNLEFGRVAKRI